MGQVVGRAVFDSNVVIAAFANEDVNHEVCEQAFLDTDLSLRVASVVTYSEVMMGAFSHSSEAVSYVDTIFGKMFAKVEPVSLEIASRAARIRAENPSIKLPDAMVVATGEHVGAEIVTVDKKLKKLGKNIKCLV